MDKVNPAIDSRSRVQSLSLGQIALLCKEIYLDSAYALADTKGRQCDRGLSDHGSLEQLAKNKPCVG